MNLFIKSGWSMAILIMGSIILLGACSEEETPKEEETPGEQLAIIKNYELPTRNLVLDEVE